MLLQIKVLLKKVPEKHIGKPVLKESLNSEQWVSVTHQTLLSRKGVWSV